MTDLKCGDSKVWCLGSSSALNYDLYIFGFIHLSLLHAHHLKAHGSLRDMCQCRQCSSENNIWAHAVFRLEGTFISLLLLVVWIFLF